MVLCVLCVPAGCFCYHCYYDGPTDSVPGRLKSGDLILDVNNISLIGVTNER